MARASLWPRIGLIALPLAFAGCRNAPPRPYPDFAPEPPAISLSAASGNAFDAYALAAIEAELAAPTYLKATQFTDYQKGRILLHLAGPLRTVRQARSKPCDFRFVPRSPLERPLYQRGWRLIGLALAWRIAAKAEAEKYDEAVDDVLTATELGFGLTGGGTLDASLGLWIADQARAALGPRLKRLGASQLVTLRDGLGRALQSKPLLEVTFEHDRLQMLHNIDELQRAYRSQDLKSILGLIDVDASDAKRELEALDPNGENRVKFFQGMADEATDETEWLKSKVRIPASKRKMDEAPTYPKRRPWRPLARHFLRAGRPLFALNDATLARTRLMLLEAEIIRQTKMVGRAPRQLPQAQPGWIQDPFTGRPFAYSSAGREYLVYSVGENFTDEGGETDPTFTSPDLTLEHSATP